MTKRCIWRMSCHVKSMCMGPAAAFLSLMLLLVVGSSSSSSSSRAPRCGNSLTQSLKLTRLIQKESVDLIKTYKLSQGDMLELLCKVSVNNLPDPTISGLEFSQRMASIYTHLQEFLPHLKRVYEQQVDLQLPSSPLLQDLITVSSRSTFLQDNIKNFYQNLFPNLPLPEPAGGPTALPPPQNVFQQKVYGCVVLKTFKDFLSNVSKELRTVKSRCRMQSYVFF